MLASASNTSNYVVLYVFVCPTTQYIHISTTSCIRFFVVTMQPEPIVLPRRLTASRGLYVVRPADMLTGNVKRVCRFVEWDGIILSWFFFDITRGKANEGNVTILAERYKILYCQNVSGGFKYVCVCCYFRLNFIYVYGRYGHNLTYSGRFTCA